jgi:uncharacterized protein with HEPN domain
MPLKTQKLLDDIRDAAKFILDSTAGQTAVGYANNRLLRQAVERNFEIIGEAMNRLRALDPTTAAQISDVKSIVAFRNVLIHGYHLIDDSEVWNVITRSLPRLQAEVESLLRSFPPTSSPPP